MTYYPEGGSESSLHLSDPAATEATLTDLQCNTNYTITVVATAGEYKTEDVAMTVSVPLQGILLHVCISVLDILAQPSVQQCTPSVFMLEAV